MSAEGKVLWIEVLSRHDAVVARHRVHAAADEEIRIGRGYDNHVIIDDPYVGARHLRLVRDEAGMLVAEDLGSANGMFLDQDRRRAERAVLDGKRTIRIGRTRLRIRHSEDEVAPERVARPRMRVWPIVAILALVALAGEFLTMWLRATGEQKLSDYLGPLVMMCVTVAVWTTGWAVLSRIFSGRARFERHLLIALSGVVGLWLVTESSPYAAFALSQREFVAYRYVLAWLVGGMVCFLHLRQLSLSRETARVRLKLKAGAVAALTLLAIGMQTLSQWEAGQNTERQAYLRALKPPTLKLARAQTSEAFFASAESLKTDLERARSEAPRGAWDYTGDDEE